MLNPALWQPKRYTRPSFDFNFTPSTYLYIDASATEIGSVLDQSTCVIAYVSRALSKCEQNYSIIQKEYLAHPKNSYIRYLLVCPFKILTEDSHKSCTTAMALCPKMESTSKVGTSNLRVRVHYSLPQQTREWQC